LSVRFRGQLAPTTAQLLVREAKTSSRCSIYKAAAHVNIPASTPKEVINIIIYYVFEHTTFRSRGVCVVYTWGYNRTLVTLLPRLYT